MYDKIHYKLKKKKKKKIIYFKKLTDDCGSLMGLK